MDNMSNNPPSGQYLTHKYASFHGCTLEEMGGILAVYAVIETPILLLLASLLGPYLGGFCGALLLLLLLCAMLTFFVLIKQTAKWVGRVRKGRPPGYLKLRLRQWLHDKAGIKILYVVRNGRWITRR